MLAIQIFFPSLHVPSKSKLCIAHISINAFVVVAAGAVLDFECFVKEKNKINGIFTAANSHFA